MTREEFIKDLVKNFDEIDTSDLQGIVMSRCMTTGEDEDEILNEIYEIVEGDKEMKVLDYNKVKEGQKALITYNNEKEEVTIGDIGTTYTDVIFENGDMRKVILEEVLIELY